MTAYRDTVVVHHINTILRSPFENIEIKLSHQVRQPQQLMNMKQSQSGRDVIGARKSPYTFYLDIIFFVFRFLTVKA